MAFWTDSTMNPKRNFRFKVTCKIDGDQATTIFYIKGINRPNFKIGDTVHNYAGHKFHFPGTVTWDGTVTLNLVDPANPDVAKAVIDLLRRSGYEIPGTIAATPKFITKAGGVLALSQLKISLLNGNGETIEEWDLKNAWISGATFSALSYDQEALSDISLTVTYDYPVMTFGGDPLDPTAPLPSPTDQ